MVRHKTHEAGAVLPPAPPPHPPDGRGVGMSCMPRPFPRAAPMHTCMHNDGGQLREPAWHNETYDGGATVCLSSSSSWKSVRPSALSPTIQCCSTNAHIHIPTHTATQYHQTTAHASSHTHMHMPPGTRNMHTHGIRPHRHAGGRRAAQPLSEAAAQRQRQRRATAKQAFPRHIPSLICVT